MKVLWICGLPGKVQRDFPECGHHRSSAEWSWILGHLPPPKGVDLHIACPVTSGPWKGSSFDYQGATFHLVRCLRGRLQTGFLLDPFFFRSLHSQLKPDLIHGWGTEDSHSIIAQQLAPHLNVVQVQGLINAYRSHLSASTGVAYVATRERITLKKARNVFVESKYSGAISQPFCSKTTRIWQVDHPLRAEFVTSPSSAQDAKQVLFLGSLTARKGYLDAVEAFAMLSPDWKLVMIGNGSADAVAMLLTKVRNAGLDSRFRHITTANTANIVKIMQSSSIYLLPSYIDTGPTSLKEALAMNLLPVCYDNTGPQELVKRFNSGFLSPTGNIGELGSSLRRATSFIQDNTSRSLLSTTRTREAFSKDAVWQQLLAAYATIAYDYHTRVN